MLRYYERHINIVKPKLKIALKHLWARGWILKSMEELDLVNYEEEYDAYLGYVFRSHQEVLVS